MLARIAGAVRFKEPLSFYTSLRIGGPAEFFIVPQDLDDVRYALAFADQEGLPLTVLGAGNNVLFSDQTIHGVVLKLGGILSRAEFQGEEVAVGAGMSLSGLIREAAARDMGGLECLAGIPASIGGALAKNAGTRDGSILDFCTAIYYVHRDGTF
ncbi:MAG: FAD-binding protein, partial [Pseudomonadota bacterium]